MTTETKPDADTKLAAQFFSLKTPLLSEGRLDNVVARTDLMSLTVKVYAEGGENAMHKHPYEDHAFIVMQGQATFHTGTDDNVRVVNKNEGVMIPKGECYWFHSSGEENLVMIRPGAAAIKQEPHRVFPDGRPFVNLPVENKRGKQVIVPGKFFAG